MVCPCQTNLTQISFNKRMNKLHNTGYIRMKKICFFIRKLLSPPRFIFLKWFVNLLQYTIKFLKQSLKKFTSFDIDLFDLLTLC